MAKIKKTINKKTKKSRNSKFKKFSIFVVILTILTTSVPNLFPTNNLASAIENEAYCTSSACRAAKKAENEAVTKANEASKAATTLEGEVERLQQEISMYEARIKANEAEAEDLKLKIEESTKKLKLQQQALANLLINMHFEEKGDAIMILAGSSSISDFAERQSRVDTAKSQVTISAQTVKSIKQDLEKQKTEIERVIADQQIQRKAIEDKKIEQQSLIIKYRDNAAAFALEAASSREEKIKLINQEYQNHLLSLRNRGGFGTVADGYNSYEAFIGNYGFACPRDNIRGILDTYYTCQCTSYAAYKAVEYWGPRVRVTGWGNAYSWASAARSLGYRVDRTPSANSIGQTASGAWGHVFWVESVNANGTINVSEYNNAYSSRSGQWGDFGYRVGVDPSQYYFIHFD